ncbi:unnamed protein product [Rhizoctonia solani]|uniref:Uncharacterized protein n=1 Tax=Rhizoctonia solani TaxID=456999 RepID=A0A8H3DJU0_9AGAM|nr:unnamed protein product [Rhizoctonia solani]CAE6526891.1 unnamed protein product [Rhizoctonia solani]
MIFNSINTQDLQSDKHHARLSSSGPGSHSLQREMGTGYANAGYHPSLWDVLRGFIRYCTELTSRYLALGLKRTVLNAKWGYNWSRPLLSPADLHLPL